MSRGTAAVVALALLGSGAAAGAEESRIGICDKPQYAGLYITDDSKYHCAPKGSFRFAAPFGIRMCGVGLHGTGLTIWSNNAGARITCGRSSTPVHHTAWGYSGW
ncbi:hypothetical protein [Allokutzneria sp. NRRL B-24872]|uniref:hypothetical protein n=1 Tax=Allokutzneria sp. NRRL B-24872 TaxID=1137961 RepID=UPI0011784494|nr:hypothetical protein [Allokutzneria sp. NRRL B-24872]